jgi:hypothetical protein
VEGKTGDVVEEELGFDGNFGIDAAFSKDPEDGFRTNANVLIEQVPAKLTLADYQRITVANAAQFDVTVIEGPTPTTLGGDPAYELVAEEEREEQKTQFRSVSAIRPDGAYTVTLTALPEQFDEANAEFDEILASFRWTD